MNHHIQHKYKYEYKYKREKDQLIDIPNKQINELNDHIVTVKYDNPNNNVRVRKINLFDKLNSHKLTYVKGGICDAYIKYGYPSLEKVINDIQTMTDQENKRLSKLLTYLKKQGLEYDSNVFYYREYIEQGTDLRTAIREGKKEWFLLKHTMYSKYLMEYKDENIAEELAIDQYVRNNGYTKILKKHIEVVKRFDMKIRLY